MSDPIKYAEPKNLEDALRRRSDLNRVRKEITESLVARKPSNAQDGANPQYKRWRKSAVLKLSHIDEELRYLKEWVHSYHKQYDTITCDGVDYQQVRQQFRNGFNNLQAFVDGIVSELRRVQVENDALRRRILELENGYQVAPAGGVDQWRMQ